MSLIYGYSENRKNSSGNTNSLIGSKSDDKTIDSAFGRIKKNKDDIVSSNSLIGSKSDDKTIDSAFGRIKKNKDDIEDIEEITNSTAIENVSTSYWWLLDASPGPHFIKKDKAPAWKPYDASNPHIEHPNEIYITAVRMSMEQNMSWVLSVELFESKMKPPYANSSRLVLTDPSDKGVSVVKFLTNDIKQSKFKSIISLANPLGYKLQDPVDFNGFYIDHIKKSGEDSGAMNSVGRKLYIDIVYKSYNKFGDHWWTSKT